MSNVNLHYAMDSGIYYTCNVAMTLLLYIAFLPRYQLRTQDGGDGEDQEDQDGGDGGDVPAHITHPVGRRLLQLQVVEGGVRQRRRGVRQ